MTDLQDRITELEAMNRKLALALVDSIAKKSEQERTIVRLEEALHTANVVEENRIAELEAQIATTPKWTRITDDPETWPPKETDFLTAWHVSNEWIVDVRWHSDARRPTSHYRIAGDVFWLPITPPQVEP